MGAISGSGLKSLQWFIRGVQFCCAALILSIYSYFLAALANHHLPIATSIRAVEGISGVAVLYTIAGVLLVCFVAGITLTSFLAVLFDTAFIAAFIYVAVAIKGGAGSCDGDLDTPFGKGKAADRVEGSKGFTALPSYRVACKLQSACLAVAIVAIFFFCFSILIEVALARHHHKEKRFGPSPQNNYTSAYGTKGSLFSRIFRRNTVKSTNDDTLPEHATPDQLDDTRRSYATERTAVDPDNNVPYNKYEQGYGHDERRGRQDGYGPIHYPDPEPEHERQTTGTYQPPAGTYLLPAGTYPAQTTETHPPQNYRYDDGVYDRT